MKKEINNKYIANLLRNMAAAYLLLNENKFKTIAYEKAADAVEHASRELKDVWQEGKINAVPGIGPSIASHLNELFAKGKSSHFDDVLSRIPSSVFVLMEVPSIGPKKAFKLVQTLRLNNEKTVIEDLLAAANAGKIAGIPTFGKKSEEDIIEAIALYKRPDNTKERMPLPYADAVAKDVMNHLKKVPHIARMDALGSLRRKVSTIGDVDIAVAIKDGEEEDVIKHFLTYPGKVAVDNAGTNKASIIVGSNIRVDLRVQTLENYGSMLQYFTGSKAHNIKLREYAIKKGLSLSEFGIKKGKPVKASAQIKNIHEEKIPFENEKKFYNYLGLPYIPPEIREGTNEIVLALKNELPVLVETKDIKGDLHTHSSYNLQPSHDLGANTYEEMVEKAASLGYEYIGFAEHNPKLSGNTKEDIVAIMKKRKHDIEKLFAHKKPKAHYFIGLEVDIMPSGELALPEEAIEYVDYLVVSVHSSFNQSIEDMTKRVLKALSYPKVKILGHPTGRLLGKREGFELNWEKIYEFSVKKNIALEINSWPQRLDLPDTLVREAVEKGVVFTIDTDAHAADQMDNMPYGVSVARRGWLSAKSVMNTRGYKAFKEWIES